MATQFVATLLNNTEQTGPVAVAIGTSEEDAIACLRDEFVPMYDDTDEDFEAVWNTIVAELRDRPRYSETEYSLYVIAL